MARLAYLKNVATLKLNEKECTGCGMCTIVCPHGVFARKGGNVSIRDRDACMECGACARNCPAGAVTVDVGVGCAAAVINSMLGRESSSCCCIIESGSTGNPKGTKQSGCC